MKRRTLINLLSVPMLILALAASLVGPLAAAGGSGGFIDSGQNLDTRAGSGVALGDLDADGDLDAFVANYHQPNTVWLNDGGGIYSDSGQRLSGVLPSRAVALGDLDGDDDLDAFVGNGIEQPDTVWLNDGSGHFTDSGQRLGRAHTTDLELTDLDGDGDLDAFVASGSAPWAASPANTVWWNNGSGFFTDSGQRLGSFPSRGLALGDLDGDGDVDAFVANEKPNPKTVWWSDGSGIFTDSGQRLGSSYSMDAYLGDVDGDGDLDAFVVNDDQPNRVWLNNGSGTFSDSGQTLGSARNRRAALADVDEDGDLDAFVTKINNQPNEVWLNDGTGTFVDSGQRLGSSSSLRVALGDVDGDSDLDAFVANNGPDKVWLYNRPPDISADSATVSVNEGETATNIGTFNDPDGDRITMSASVGTLTQDTGSSGAWAWSFDTDDGPDDSKTVTITAEDGKGGTGQTTLALTVHNVPPSVSIEQIVDETGNVIGVDVDVAPVGLALDLTGSFSDPGADSHDASVDWDDGTVDDLGAVSSPVGASHTYEEPGTYEIELTVTDKDGGAGQRVVEIEVVEPAGAVEDSIDDLAELADDPALHPEAAEAIEEALDGLAGRNDGQAHNGVLDKLEAGDVNAALNRLGKVLEDLEAAEAADGSLDLITVKAQLALTAKALAIHAIAQAEAVASSRGELKQVERANELLAEGDSLLDGGDYTGAVDRYQGAWQKAMAALS